MSRQIKSRMNITVSEENVVWLKQLSKQSGIPMSLFIDTLLTGTRMSLKDGLSEREAVSMALEHVAKGIRNKK